MPYIIWTHKPITQHGIAGWDQTRHAVATLEEAQGEAGSAVVRHTERYSLESREFLTQASDLPESGGTIGPLPDGTVIEVEPCDRFWLLREMGRDEHSSDTVAEIIAAYNRKETARTT